MAQSQLTEILERKNACFRRFHEACSRFLDEIAKDDVSKLEPFQAERQAILDVLQKLEGEFRLEIERSKIIPSLSDELESDRMRTQLHSLVREKDSILKSIQDLDDQILNHINRMKNETILKLSAVNSSRRTISAYKSPLAELEQAATKLDEEA